MKKVPKMFQVGVWQRVSDVEISALNASATIGCRSRQANVTVAAALARRNRLDSHISHLSDASAVAPTDATTTRGSAMSSGTHGGLLIASRVRSQSRFISEAELPLLPPEEPR